MTNRILLALLAVVLAIRQAPAAEESLGAHTEHQPKPIVIDNERIQPSALELGSHDAVVFENHSATPMTVTFTEPDDQRDRVLCGLVRKGTTVEARAPWQLFAWSDGRLAATIPPGRFASICSFREGTYSYTVSRVGAASGGGLPNKGQILVR